LVALRDPIAARPFCGSQVVERLAPWHMAALPLVTRVQSQDRVRRVGVFMPIAADDAEAPLQSPARQRSSHRSNNSAVAEASVRQRTGDLDIVGIDEF
jgi:hypothetical protein